MRGLLFILSISIIFSSQNLFATSFLTPTSKWNQYNQGSSLFLLPELNTELVEKAKYSRMFPVLLSAFLFVLPVSANIGPDNYYKMPADRRAVEVNNFPSLPKELASKLAIDSVIVTDTVPVIAAEVESSIPTDITTEAATVKPKKTLTVAEMLVAGKAPKVNLLKDILFTFKLYPGYLDTRDYTSFRASLRNTPAMDLRKTCKLLKPFLPQEKQAEFEKSYLSMIDAVNDMDVLALKRFQGSGIPKVGEKDEPMLKLLDNAVTKLENLIEPL